jgi:hypothetical protein
MPGSREPQLHDTPQREASHPSDASMYARRNVVELGEVKLNPF